MNVLLDVSTCILMHTGSVCTSISAARCLVCTALYPWPSMLCDPAYSLICLHQGTGEVTTHQSAVRFWRISTRDIWGVEGHSQVLCHVGGFWLTGHVVPCQALLCIDLGLAHVIVSPGRRVMLHGMCHAAAHSLQSEQYGPKHRWSRAVCLLWNFFLSLQLLLRHRNGRIAEDFLNELQLWMVQWSIWELWQHVATFVWAASGND